MMATRLCKGPVAVAVPSIRPEPQDSPGVAALSAEAAGDEALRTRIHRSKKDVRRKTELDQFSKQHESHLVGNAGRLLQIMRHDDDRMFVLQLMNGLLNVRR